MAEQGSGQVAVDARRSPLRGWEQRFAAAAPAVELAEVAFQTTVNLRVAGPAASAVFAALGLAPPSSTAISTAGDLLAIRLAPDEFLLRSGELSAALLESLVVAALGGAHGAAVDVSAQFTAIALAGPEARDLLAGGCSTDLSAAAAPTGTSVQVPIAQTGVLVVVTDAAAGAFLLIVRSSFADYLASWLTMGATEYLGADKASQLRGVL